MINIQEPTGCRGIAIFSKADHLELEFEINDWLLDNQNEIMFIDCKLSVTSLQYNIMYTIVILYEELPEEF